MACSQVMSGEHRTLGSTLVLQGRKQLKQACGLIKSNVCVDVYWPEKLLAKNLAKNLSKKLLAGGLL